MVYKSIFGPKTEESVIPFHGRFSSPIDDVVPSSVNERLLGPQHALAVPAPPPLADHLAHPVRQAEPPVPGHQRAAEDVDELDEKDEEAVARLDNVEQDGLNVVLEKDAGDGALVDLAALLRDGVLVGGDGAAAAAGRVADAVHGRHDGHEVLELVEGDGGRVDGAVERILERGEVGAERELRDDV
jgi:hypothetical protein